MGFIVLVFPLALWAVPQHGVLANTVFYIVLSIGGSALASLMALVYVKGRLFPDPALKDAPKGGKARLLAYKSWAESQDDTQRVKKQFSINDFRICVQLLPYFSHSLPREERGGEAEHADGNWLQGVPPGFEKNIREK